jgi:hypothetical protein
VNYKSSWEERNWNTREDREQSRRQAANSAVRCFFKALECYFKDDTAGVEKWLAHVETLVAIVRESP